MAKRATYTTFTELDLMIIRAGGRTQSEIEEDALKVVEAVSRASALLSHAKKLVLVHSVQAVRRLLAKSHQYTGG